MTTDAFRYAFGHIALPSGKTLWLYGNPAFATGDTYHPLYDQAALLWRKANAVYSDIPAITQKYDAVFVDCPKQREETEGLIAFALAHSHGFVMAVAANDAGGGRIKAIMESYGVPVNNIAKHKCRIVWTQGAAQANAQRMRQGLSYLEEQKVEMDGKGWWTVPGIFGWDKIDPGSRLLMEHLPAGMGGKVADFGCGYGYISTMLEARYPFIHHIDAYDIDARAVSCCARNTVGKTHAQWCDIRTLDAARKYDWIVMNPPFHQGKAEARSLGLAFIHKAQECLLPGGQLFLVANSHLPYEKHVSGLEKIAAGHGYEIFKGSAA